MTFDIYVGDESAQEYDVFAVNWGEDGVRSAQQTNPNLVILDIRLPDIDGYEVAHRLRKDRRTATIPIIFLTEKRDRADRLQGLELCADDYITKPFDVQELRLRVRNALNRVSQGSLTKHKGKKFADLTQAEKDELLLALLQRAGMANKNGKIK